MAIEAFIDRMVELEELQADLSVTNEQYEVAVNELYRVAMAGTGQSDVCAQVLLSTYDGYNYRANLADLGGIDLDLLNHALTVIRGRAVNMIEPHEVVDNGKEMFVRLKQRWSPFAIMDF